MHLALSLNHEKTYILAVSGGVDSMALLHFLNMQNYHIVVVHFNHQKRKASILDEKIVSDFCSKHNIPYHYFVLNVPKGNFQANARVLRYKHLKEVATTYNTPYIVTAHHADDLLETFAMRLYKKQHLLNLVGMQPSFNIDSFIYLKPLLHLTKVVIKDYALANQIPYQDDYTNFHNDYLRNRLRNQILPKLATDTLLNTVLSLSNQLIKTQKSIREQTLKFISTEQSFLLKDFLLLNILVQDDVILYFLERSKSRISTTFIKEIKKQFNSSKNTILIPLGTYQLIKSYGKISFGLQEVNMQTQKIAIFSHKEPPNEKPYIELCYNELDLPLQLRRKQPGDVLEFTYGHKKLNRFLIDKKIPVLKRDALWCVVDAKNRILWIPNVYINQTLGNLKKTYLSLKEN